VAHFDLGYMLTLISSLGSLFSQTNRMNRILGEIFSIKDIMEKTIFIQQAAPQMNN